MTRTRRRLKQALLQLIEEVDYDDITVADIADRADVGRSTFYSHFGSKEDLLFDQFDVWLLSLADAAPAAGAKPDPADPGFRFSLPLLRHVGSDTRLFQAVMGSRSGARVRRRATQLVTAVARRELARRGRPEMAGVDADADLDARAHAVAGAFLGLAAWWMDASRDLTPEAVDALFQATVR
ncbi:MAG: TetR/AcrR family transcriptional regulator [Gemmatimonadetes bacterium]|nr:TetR/AcrR family transcriptional regulator [Gemmatimonadota bacterium]